MQLMTKEIRKKLPSIGTHNQHETDLKLISVPVKFFNPAGPGYWYIIEWDGKDIMFGLCALLPDPATPAELGEVSLSELKSIRGAFGLGIERDRHWKGSLADAYNELERRGYFVYRDRN